MKRILFLTVLLSGLVTQRSNAQSTTTPNNYASGYYLGWSSGGNPLPFATAGSYQMELLGTGDLNIIQPYSGYMIHNNYMLWNHGDVTSLYTGAFAGNGYNVGIGNTFWGYYAGNSISSGSYNCFGGYGAGYSDTTGASNVFLGSLCGLNNTIGDFNCANGANAFFNNLTGDSNVVMGAYADYNGGGAPSDSVQAGLQNLNVFIGHRAVPSFYSGDSNVFIGALSDINTNNPGIIQNAGAFGYGAIATANDKIILGNNLQDVGIGMSGLNVGTGPTNRLEISYFSQSAPEPCYFFPSTFADTAPCNNQKIPSGASGLQFRDLTTKSIPWPYVSNHGFLTVDDSGNVVYMLPPPFQASDSGGGFGTCCNPATFPTNDTEGCTFDPALNLAANGGHNLWFQGNGEGSSVNNVMIGYQCGTTPPAKLSVLQQSGTNGSMCGYFENEDAGSCQDAPVYGIKSLVDNPNGKYTKIAGWFEATQVPTCCIEDGSQYAILVPQRGGNVEIGINVSPEVPCANSQYLLDVYGSGYASGTFYSASDSTLKTNIASINKNNNALSVIQKLNGVSFNYQNSAIGDSGMSGTHYGFIAQQVSRVLPNVVKTDNHGKEAVGYTEIIPWLVEGMKQQQGTIDSLKRVLNSVQSCLNTICSNSQFNGLNGDGNTAVINTQEVTLSAGLNTPLLYQNIPNPFSTGTKINYYLPQGTLGATIVFYDAYGTQLKVVPLSQTGNGTLNITPDNLTDGIYSYSLVVNGSIIDTKRMILQK
jgi:Chaperone of endosialidase